MLTLILFIMLLFVFLRLQIKSRRTQLQKRRGSRMPMDTPRKDSDEVDAMDVDARDEVEVEGYGTQIQSTAIRSMSDFGIRTNSFRAAPTATTPSHTYICCWQEERATGHRSAKAYSLLPSRPALLRVCLGLHKRSQVIPQLRFVDSPTFHHMR